MSNRLLLTAIVLFVLVATHGGITAQTSDRVELDVVVLDGHDNPVTGLQESDFQIREDRKPVAIHSFDEIGSADQPAQRIVALILDDSGVPPNLTSRVQQIAQRFMARIAPGDRVDVVRLNHRTDEATGNRAIATDRIEQFRAGTFPLFGRETIETALTKIANLSKGFAQVEHRRKEIVAIGAPRTFDVSEPTEGESSLIWDYWLNAVASASRANTNVYVVDPAGLSGGLTIQRSVGIVEKTGGASFYNSFDFDKAAARVWSDAGHYYVLGYTPPSVNQDLRDIEVTVSRTGARVVARKMRG
jgi:VWFA-related protein